MAHSRGTPVTFAPFYPQPNTVTTTAHTHGPSQTRPMTTFPFTSTPSPAGPATYQGAPTSVPPRGRGYGIRGRGRGFNVNAAGRGRGSQPGPSSPFMSISLKAMPIQPPSSPEPTTAQPTATPSPSTVTHRVTRTLQRGASLSPLDVHIFYGPIGTFLEDYGSDVVITSSFKGGFRSSTAKSSFCGAAQACGVDVTSLEYKDFVSADYNLHMIEPVQNCGALWLVELKIGSAMSPVKPKDLVECYDMLKLHAREVIQENTETLTMPLIGKGSKTNYFQTGRSEVIVELVGFLYWIAENLHDRPNLREINIITSNEQTAFSLQSAFDVLIPIQVAKLEEALAKVLPVTSSVLNQFESELRKADQAEKAEREEARSRKEQNGESENMSGHTDQRLALRERRERRRKLSDVVTKLRTIHKSAENIHAALQATSSVREVSIIILACAVNGRIVAELCSELFLLQDGFLGPSAGGAEPGRGHFIPSSTSQPSTGFPVSSTPSGMADNLWGRMVQLQASGKMDSIFPHFQTLRLIGNKAAHSSVLKATMVDLAAIVLAVRGILLSPHFAPGRA